MKPYLTTRDFAFSNEEFQLLLDEERSLLVTHPRPENLDPYYAGLDYISHTDESKGLINTCYQIVKRYATGRKLHLLQPFVPKGGKLLDIGAGTGSFVRAAEQRGWEARGVEPNETARGRALKKGADVVASLEELDKDAYSVITLWHVLEHLPDLEFQIGKVLSFLEEKGTLVLALPNYRSWDARYYGKYWAAYDVPRHLWHFSRESVTSIFADYGMRIIEIKPMIFDPFYIALLSGKYKNGRSNPFMAFLVGLYSNITAWRSKEYSSLIYILQRVKN